jgi:hypothetical protein
MTGESGRHLGGGLRATLRGMPASVAVGYVLLVTAAAVTVALALVAGLLGEFAERLAAAGWAYAATVRAAHPAPQPGPAADPAPGPGAADFEVVA